jgi:GntR family transcriptional regulator
MEKKRTGKLEESSLKKNDKAMPLYEKLKRSLCDQIEMGLFEPGELIPSERTLCQQNGISRITVRRCLSELINEGLLYRKQGKGTFVARRKIRQGLARIVNFTRTVLELGMKPSTAILAVESIGASGEVAKELGLTAAASVVRLALLGKGDEEPLVLYESFFPLEIGMKMAEEARIREKEGAPFSTYDLYGESSGVFPTTVSQTFEAVVATDPLSTILKVKRGFPLLLIQSVFTSRDERPLEFRKALYRGDRYKFHMIRDFNA